MQMCHCVLAIRANGYVLSAPEPAPAVARMGCCRRRQTSLARDVTAVVDKDARDHARVRDMTERLRRGGGSQALEPVPLARQELLAVHASGQLSQ